MKLIIVSGLSGSGKSSALHTLEDLGFYCIDNLPLTLLYQFARQMTRRREAVYQNLAVGIDARNLEEDLQRFPKILKRLRASGFDCELFFFGADDAVLLKRFSETRRKHPLTRSGVSLAEAVRLERQLLEPISMRADMHFDTSRTNIHQLRDLIRERVVGRREGKMSLLFESFGYKHGVPSDADFVFDVRCLPNPHWEPHLRSLTGRDESVQEFLRGQPAVTQMQEDLKAFLSRWIPRFEADNRSYLTVAVGCTGGQHRSVYMVEQLAAHFRYRQEYVLTRHRDLS